MDRKLIISQLDSIISDLTDKSVRLTKKDVRLINKIISEIDSALVENKEGERIEFLDKLDAVKDAVTNNEAVSKQSGQKIIEAIEKIRIEAPIVNVAPAKVNVPPVDLSQIKINFPTEMSIKKPSWLSSPFDQSVIVKVLGEVRDAIKNFVFPSRADKPISVRLTDGEKFYRAMGGGYSSGGNTLFQFKKANNEASAGLVDDDAHVQVDVLELPENLATISKQNEIIDAIKTSGNFFDGYKISDTDDDASPNYYGFVKTDGNWYILKETLVAGANTYRYIKGDSGYATNWTGRTGLTYDYLFNVFS